MPIYRRKPKKILVSFEERGAQGELVITQEIQQALAEQVGRPVVKSTLSRLLRRNQWRKVVPRPRNPKSSEEIQEQFKQNFSQEVQSLIAQHPSIDTRPVILMAQDEARFGRISQPKRCWAPKPVRPIVLKEVVREYLWVFAAVCPQLGRLCALLLPHTNAEMMRLFLTEVSSEFKEYVILMVLDRAAWHTSSKLTLPENIRLLPLPPGSPELNPAEHLWEHLREKELGNRRFETLDLLEDSLCEGINRLHDAPQLVRSLTYFPYFNCQFLNAT